MEKDSLPMLLAAFVALIIGVSLIGVIASQGNAVTDLTVVSAESVDFSSTKTVAGNDTVNVSIPITLANAPTGWKIVGCPITGLTLANESGTALTITTDYTFTASTGTIYFKNTAINNVTTGTNISTAYYNYCGNDYINQSWSRNIIDLVPGFFALALMAVGIGLFYGVMKKEGMLGL